MNVYHRMAIGCVVLLLSGCAGMTQMQDAVTKFDQGTHTAATAEVSYITAVRSADCTYAFYTKTANWALGAGSQFDITDACTPSILTDDQIATRQALMDAITLYADKMVALATADNDKSLDSSSRTLAGKLNAPAAKAGAGSGLEIAKAVETAILEIAKMALDQRGFRDIKEAAHQMGPQLEAVVEALKAENTDAAAGIASKLGGVQLILRQVVASAHVTPGPMGFFDVVAARQMLQAADPLNPNEPPAAAAATAWNTATRVNAALDAVVNVNQAIANAGTGGIVAAVNELVARANDAVAIHAALK